jgi:hypothetical protein
MSKAGGVLLARALQHNIDMQYNAFLTPVIETAIRCRCSPFALASPDVISATVVRG